MQLAGVMVLFGILLPGPIQPRTSHVACRLSVWKAQGHQFLDDRMAMMMISPSGLVSVCVIHINERHYPLSHFCSFSFVSLCSFLFFGNKPILEKKLKNRWEANNECEIHISERSSFFSDLCPLFLFDSFRLFLVENEMVTSIRQTFSFPACFFSFAL